MLVNDVNPCIRVRLPITCTDILSAVIVEILSLKRVISLVERIELIGHADAMTKGIGHGNNCRMHRVELQCGINHVIARGRAGDHQSRGDVSLPSRITLMPFAGKVAPNVATVKLKVLAARRGAAGGLRLLSSGKSSTAGRACRTSAGGCRRW